MKTLIVLAAATTAAALIIRRQREDRPTKAIWEEATRPTRSS